VQGVELEQQPVAQDQLTFGARAFASQLEHRVGAIGVGVHQVIGDAYGAQATAPDADAAERPVGDVGVARAHFAPCDLAVAVQVEPEREIDVAQGDVPLTADGAAGDLEYQVAVAGLVCHGR